MSPYDKDTMEIKRFLQKGVAQMQYAVVRDMFNKTFTKIYVGELGEAESHDEAKRLCRKENASFLIIQILGRYSAEERPVAYEKLD